jgi:signal transduction histidine kinase/CheY-like chemotaxis protein
MIRVVQDVVIGSLTDFATLPIPGGFCEVDGTILGMNEAAERLFGRSISQVVGKKAWDLAPGAEHIWDEVLALARKQGAFRGEIAIATPREPRQIHYIVTLREIGSRSFVLVFALDQPEERSTSNIDTDSQYRLEALGLVAGGIAHDFNNQLVSVLAEATAAREDAALSEPSREALRRIEDAAHRMAQLTRQLLAYAGRGRFVTELIDPDELVQQTQDALARIVRPDAVLDVAIGAGGIALEADRALLGQVIQNLVANGSEALGDGGGTITISTKLDGGKWVLEISDTGGGMDTHTSARMFDPFFTTKRDRHGLGLSAVHGIVRRLGGEIDVSTRVGSGTIVRVTLPVVAGAQPVRKRTTSKQVPVPTLHDIRVLVADDEPGVLSTVQRLLTRRGAQVVVAANGAEAKARLEDGVYQIVLFDVMMPELTGYQLLPIARALQPTARVMLMSGFTEHTRRASAGGDEPDAFLEKPFTAKVLDQAIDELLADR